MYIKNTVPNNYVKVALDYYTASMQFRKKPYKYLVTDSCLESILPVRFKLCVNISVHLLTSFITSGDNIEWTHLILVSTSLRFPQKTQRAHGSSSLSIEINWKLPICDYFMIDNKTFDNDTKRLTFSLLYSSKKKRKKNMVFNETKRFNTWLQLN